MPQITLFFGVIKILCTTVGETAADFLNVSLNLRLTGTSVVMGLLLVFTLFFHHSIKTIFFIKIVVMPDKIGWTTLKTVN